MAHLISGRIAQWVALPFSASASIDSMQSFQPYYFNLGLIAVIAGGLMAAIAIFAGSIHGQEVAAEASESH